MPKLTKKDLTVSDGWMDPKCRKTLFFKREGGKKKWKGETRKGIVLNTIFLLKVALILSA